MVLARLGDRDTGRLLASVCYSGATGRRWAPGLHGVRYEELILNTRETLEAICTFIALEYDDAMLRYYNRTPERLKEHKGRFLPNGTTLISQDQRIRQQQRTTGPPDPACIFAWKSAMSVKERARFKLVAGDLLRELGYEV